MIRSSVSGVNEIVQALQNQFVVRHAPAPSKRSGTRFAVGNSHCSSRTGVFWGVFQRKLILQGLVLAEVKCSVEGSALVRRALAPSKHCKDRRFLEGLPTETDFTEAGVFGGLQRKQVLCDWLNKI